jgi:hypothetical protein
MYFGPTAPAGQESNWIETVPGRGKQVQAARAGAARHRHQGLSFDAATGLRHRFCVILRCDGWIGWDSRENAQDAVMASTGSMPSSTIRRGQNPSVTPSTGRGAPEIVIGPKSNE